MVLYIYLREERAHLIEYVILEAVNFGLYKLTDARMSFYLSTLLLIYVYVMRFYWQNRKDRIRKKEKRHKALLADMAEAERIIMKMPEGLSRQILEQVYLEGMSQQEVGEVVGYTQSMVSKIIKTTMKDS